MVPCPQPGGALSWVVCCHVWVLPRPVLFRRPVHRKTTLSVNSARVGGDAGCSCWDADYLAAAVFLSSVWLAGHPLRFLSLLQVQCLPLCLLPAVIRHCTSLLSWTQNTVPLPPLLSNKYRKQMVTPHCFSWAPQLEPRRRVLMLATPACIRSVAMTVGPDICNFQVFFKQYWPIKPNVLQLISI